MKLIIGLGNPGKEYESTRHNTGYIILEELRKIWDFPDFEFNKKFNAEMTEGNFLLPSRADSALAEEVEGSNEKIILIKPQTFMNNSGEAVRKIMDFYKITPDDIAVIQDDLDIEKGKFKTSIDSSSAGHHGIESIIEHLGTQKFERIRVGIGRETVSQPACRLDAHDYVLQNFSEEELVIIKNLTPSMVDQINKFMTKFTGR